MTTLTDDRLDDLVSRLRSTVPDLTLHVDRAEDPSGESFIDIRSGTFETHVSFKPAFGFGLFLKDGLFGQRPDEFVATPEAVVARLSSMLDSARKKDTRLSSTKG